MTNVRIKVMVSGVACAVLLTACQPADHSAAQDLSGLSGPERHLFEQASVKRSHGNAEEAINLYTQAAKLSQGSVEAHIAIAEMLRADNKAQQSIPMLKEALNLKPKDARLHMEMGFARIASEQYDEAIESFERAISYDEELGSAYSGKAVAYDLKGDHNKAQQLYSEAKARGLSTPAMENNYGLSLIFSGKYDAAIAMLKPHADASYATTTMKQNLALAYGLKGDVGNASTYGSDGLDPISAKKNMEFYKRFTALKYGHQPQKLAVMSPAAGGAEATNQAVPVAPVASGDIGFVTDNGKSQQVLIQPKVEVVEIDSEVFQELVK